MRSELRRRTLRLLSRLAVIAVAAALLGPVRAEETWPQPPEPSVRYVIDAKLRRVADEKERELYRIVGREEISWRNDSAETVPVLYFHLYANAFRNRQSSLLREMTRDGRGPDDDAQFGGVEITELKVGDDVLEPVFVQPDDGNPHDRTVARVELRRPVLPGEQILVNVRFTTSLPSVIRRMGQHEGFVMAAQWYPKLGRYVGRDDAGPNVHDGWYCHQYHASTEFFADYADYEVSLTTPQDMVVGATGVPDERETINDAAGVRTVVHRARSVVDFAWTAHDRFLRFERTVRPADPERIAGAVAEERRRLQTLLGLSDEEVLLPEVKVVLLLQPEHEDQKERHFTAAEHALGLFGLWFGPYPYAQLTVVDPAFGAKRAGGMEYPMLVTAGTRIGNTPEAQQPEGVIVHEIGHQWFMNLLATNEAEEAWLDEGIDTYFTGYFLDLCYGPAMRTSHLLGRPVSGTLLYDFPGASTTWPGHLGLPEWATPPEMEVFDAWRDLPWLSGVPSLRYRDDFALKRRPSWVRGAGWDPGVQPGWEYVTRRSYGSNVYSRGALFMNTVRRRLKADLGEVPGERAFVRSLRRYARQHRWSHPTTDDLLGTIARTSGWDPAGHADALLRTSAVLEYGVESIRHIDVPGSDAEDAAEIQRSEIVVRRGGEAVAPLVLEVTRDAVPSDAGRWERVDWDGTDRWKRFTVDGTVTAARLDGARIYLQDVDRTNQSLASTTSKRPALKWSVRFLVWLENALLSYGRFF